MTKYTSHLLKFFKIAELVIIYFALILLLLFSFLNKPTQINCDPPCPELNYQFGIVYLIEVTMTLIFSGLLVIRLYRPNKIMRTISVFVISMAIILAYLVFFKDVSDIEYIIRKMIYD